MPVLLFMAALVLPRIQHDIAGSLALALTLASALSLSLLLLFTALRLFLSLSLSLHLSISFSVALNALHAMDEDSTAARIVRER